MNVADKGISEVAVARLADVAIGEVPLVVPFKEGARRATATSEIPLSVTFITKTTVILPPSAWMASALANMTPFKGR